MPSPTRVGAGAASTGSSAVTLGSTGIAAIAAVGVLVLVGAAVAFEFYRSKRRALAQRLADSSPTKSSDVNLVVRDGPPTPPLLPRLALRDVACMPQSPDAIALPILSVRSAPGSSSKQGLPRSTTAMYDAL